MLGSLLGGGGGDSTQSTESESKTVTENLRPKWITRGSERLVKEGELLRTRDYPTYDPNKRIAPLNTDQNEALAAMRERSGKYTPIFDEAITKAQGAGNRFDSDWRDYYMNPYTDSVLDGVNRRYNSETDRQLQALRAKQVSQGALYGPDVMRNLINPYIEQRSLSQGDINNQILSEAYDKSYNMFAGDEDRALKAADALGTQAQRGYNAAGTDIDTQFNYGEKQRALQQALKDLEYEEFQNEFYYPQMQSDWYRQLLANVPTNTTQVSKSKSSSTTEGSGGSMGLGDILSGVGGFGLGAAGIAGQLGWSPFSGGSSGGMGLSFLSDLMSSSGGNTISGGGSTFMM